MIINEGLECALKSALTESGISQADQYNEALVAFNAAFGEVVRDTVRDLLDKNAEVPLVTQVFSANKAVNNFRLPFTKEGSADGNPDKIASIAYFKRGSTCVWICVPTGAGQLVWVRVCS
jgi:hypothetical protein